MLLASLIGVGACGEASRNSPDDTEAATTSGGASSAQGTSMGTGGLASTSGSTASTSGSAATTGGGTSSTLATSTTGGTTTGSGAAGGGGGGALSDPACRVENSVLIDECPGESRCVPIEYNEAGAIYQCVPMCTSDDDCEGGEECYMHDNLYIYCGAPRPECEPNADVDSCNCETVSSAVLVTGSGEACEVLNENASACFWQVGTCLDACIDEYYRYDLGDGTALIVRALQGQMPPGWVSDGQGGVPASCPVVEAEQME